MKTYPMKLSPVLEKLSPNRKSISDLDTGLDNHEELSKKAEVHASSPALMKQQANATLRITPPSEDEHGKIWIPMTEEKVPGSP